MASGIAIRRTDTAMRTTEEANGAGRAAAVGTGSGIPIGTETAGEAMSETETGTATAIETGIETGTETGAAMEGRARGGATRRRLPRTRWRPPAPQ